jgi:hypothetical protein
MSDKIMIHNLGGMSEEDLKAILNIYWELDPRFYRDEARRYATLKFKQREVGKLFMTTMIENKFGWRVAWQDKFRRESCLQRSRIKEQSKEVMNRREDRKEKAEIREKEKDKERRKRKEQRDRKEETDRV